MSSEGWKSLIFSEFVDINPLVRLDYSNEYSFVEMKDLNETLKYVYPSQKRKLTGGAKFQNNDTLFARITPCLENGKICQVKDLDGGFGFGSTEFLVFRGINGISDTDFVFYLSRSPVVRNFAEQNLIGTSGRQRVNKEAFSNLILFLPPLSTQHRIAEILSALDNKIELNRQTNVTLEAIAQSIFKEWFVDFNYPGATGELVDSPLGPIPQGWQVSRLGDLADLSWGDTNTTKSSYTSEGYVAYSASGPDGYLPYYDYSKDGIVVSAIGAYSGRTWFAQEKWSCIKNTIRFWSTCKRISNEYLYLYTSRNFFWPLRGSAQPFISQTDARNSLILVPDGVLAMFFGEIVKAFFRLIYKNDLENINLIKMRDSLLPKLLSGEIEV